MKITGIDFLNGHRKLLTVVAWTLLLFTCEGVYAQDKNLVVRVARIRVDSTQLEAYQAALKEEIETSVRVEAGVLTLNAVSEKNAPAHIVVFEIYANQNAYKAHLEAPHFKKYKSATNGMVKSLELIETVPIALETKAK